MKQTLVVLKLDPFSLHVFTVSKNSTRIGDLGLDYLALDDHKFP